MLTHVVPSAAALLQKLAQRHQALGRHVVDLRSLLAAYGAEKLEHAIQEVLRHDVPHPHAVRQVLERNREADGEAAALPLPLPANPRIDRLGFTPHSLADHEAFLEELDDETDQEDDQ